jgi:arsenate reductase (glutaredoxin)
MKVTLHGIKNCDTMKRARTWLESHGIEYRFHDYKTEGVDRAALESWVKKVGLDAQKAVALMLEQPSMIKRPVLERGKTLLVGFGPERYAALASKDTNRPGTG